MSLADTFDRELASIAQASPKATRRYIADRLAKVAAGWTPTEPVSTTITPDVATAHATTLAESELIKTEFRRLREQVHTLRATVAQLRATITQLTQENTLTETTFNATVTHVEADRTVRYSPDSATEVLDVRLTAACYGVEIHWTAALADAPDVGARVAVTIGDAA